MKNECWENTYEVSENSVQCNLCPHNCIIPTGMSGKCRVRENSSQKLILSNYGKVVCAKLDTLAQRPIYDYKSHNVSDRTAKSLTIGLTGCNNFCPFCQNFEVSQVKDFGSSYILTPKEIVHNAIKNQVRCISFTFSEPIVWFEYMMDCIKEAEEYAIPSPFDLKNKLRKFDIILKTAGYVSPFHRSSIINSVDAINLDIKPLNKEYLKKCGIEDNQYVEDFLKKSYFKKHVEVSHLIIEGVNDKDEDVRKFADLMIECASTRLPIHLLRHYPAWKSNYPVTKDETIENAANILRSIGFSRVYTEKVQ